MPLVTIVIGILLILLGGWGYLGQPDEAARSVTALIPAFFGGPLLVCGLLGLGPRLLHMIGMHLAMLIALLGALAPLGRLIPSSIKNGFELNAATGTMITMMVLNVILLVLGIRSFINARKAKNAS